ncbi:ABC transporter ATP-binding protein, partial [Candidatus Aerophobetes bacterium]|nr:ABC transporter ATP-binding protein [Candidatus Aerophobetes bacterium]
LYPHMISRENLAFPFRLRRWPEFMIDEKIEFTAQTLGVGFRELLGRMPRTLSQGQKQRVALGRCIIRNPSVFLLDEPLSSLDAKLRIKTRVEIKKILRKFSITTVYVTHDQSEAVAISDRIAVMREGKIEQVGSFEELYNRPVNLFVASFLGNPSMNFLPVVLAKEKERLFLVEPLSGLRIPVPREWEGKILEKKKPGDDLIFGIRPEDIRPVQKDMNLKSGEFFLFQAEVEDREVTVENKVHLFLKLGHHRFMAAFENLSLPLPVRKTADFVFPVKKGKIFDAKSELALTF